MLRDLIIFFGSIAVSLGGLVLVRRRVLLETLQAHHEVAGITYAVLAGLYGVILAFVLVSSWERFEDVRHTVEAEANTLGNIRRHALAFPEPTRTTLAKAVTAYAHGVIAHDWPAMAEGRANHATNDAYLELWNAVTDIDPGGSNKLSVLFQNTLDRIDDMSAARRERLLYANSALPGLIWAYLVSSGALTVAFTYFFGMSNLRVQMVITAALTATICSALVLILELQAPFHGALRLPPKPFEFLLQRITDEAGQGLPG